MLKTRVITALVILPITLLALFLASDWAWAIFTLGITAVACWEWSRLCQFSLLEAAVYLTASALLAITVILIYQFSPSIFRNLAQYGFVVATVFWVLAAPYWLFSLWRTRNKLVMALTGWVVIMPTWLALLYLREVSPWLLLSFAVIVWVADVSAYFVGKKFGKRKLAAAISPGKTLEGAIGGLVGVTAYFFLWQWLLDSTFVGQHTWALAVRANLPLLFGFFIVLAVLSILGDLFESSMKRGAGMKDSSNLLPGHGGFLDRIDALTSTLPVAGLYTMWVLSQATP